MPEEPTQTIMYVRSRGKFERSCMNSESSASIMRRLRCLSWLDCEEHLCRRISTPQVLENSSTRSVSRPHAHPDCHRTSTHSAQHPASFSINPKVKLSASPVFNAKGRATRVVGIVTRQGQSLRLSHATPSTSMSVCFIEEVTLAAVSPVPFLVVFS